MRIELFNISKRYVRDWIFRDVSLTFDPGESYALLGPNGSGKSTLLQIISGYVSPSAGIRTYQYQDKIISNDAIYRFSSCAAPYLELVEEFTLLEQLQFHNRFKAFVNGKTIDEMVQVLGMKKHQHKNIQFFSSGMKQRVKLALALCSDVPLVLLDEPLTNLDKEGEQWYLELIKGFGAKKTVIIASNRPAEYEFCKYQVSVMEYK